MEFTHHGLPIVLSDDLWAEAGMAGFAPSSTAYHADPRAFPGQRIFEVRIEDIGPVRRAPGVGIFNDDRDRQAPARERVVAILQGFRCDAMIPPVQVVKAVPLSAYPYKLVHGTHRRQFAESTSACSKTVSVAFSCLSGGYPYFRKMRLTSTRRFARMFSRTVEQAG